jgi:glutathione peroxidase
MHKNRMAVRGLIPLVLGAGLAALITSSRPGISRADKIATTQPATQPSTQPHTEEDQTVPATLNFKMRSLEGQDVDLAKYKGKVVMMVNVASKCGLTPQYKALEDLHEKYKDRGLAILGFPANNFGKQEPGNDPEIKTFCEKNYGVKFDMFSKISVKGDDQAPLYKYLTEKGPAGSKGKDISWNFEKFLIGRNGEIAARFDPPVKPDSPEVVKAIEAELAKKS